MPEADARFAFEYTDIDGERLCVNPTLPNSDVSAIAILHVVGNSRYEVPGVYITPDIADELIAWLTDRKKLVDASHTSPS